MLHFFRELHLVSIGFADLHQYCAKVLSHPTSLPHFLPRFSVIFEVLLVNSSLSLDIGCFPQSLSIHSLYLISFFFFQNCCTISPILLAKYSQRNYFFGLLQ